MEVGLVDVVDVLLLGVFWDDWEQFGGGLYVDDVLSAGEFGRRELFFLRVSTLALLAFISRILSLGFFLLEVLLFR